MATIALSTGGEPAEPKAPEHVSGDAKSVSVDPSKVPVTPDEKQAERPAWLPEKFKTPEELAKSYGELEKKLGGKTPPETPAPEKGKAPEVTPTELDMAPFAEEFAKDGKLSADSLSKLKAAGISEKMANQYIAGQQALAEQITREVTAAAGGEEALKAAMEWANANMGENDKRAFNAATASGDLAAAKLAIQGLVAEYTRATGADPSFITNGEERSTAGSFPPFASQAEVTEAMSDKRYKTDPAYRKKVEQRLANTNMFGV